MVRPLSDLPALSGLTLNGEPWTWEDSRVVVGGFEVAALPGCELWRKLVQGDLGSDYPVTTLLAAPSWPKAALKSLTTLIPPSRYKWVVAVSDPKKVLFDFLTPSHPIAAFAIVLGDPVYAITGAPSDQAWDAFADVLARL